MLAPLFKLTVFGPRTLIEAASACADQAEALAQRLADTRLFGQFRETIASGGSYASMKLSFPSEQAEALSVYLLTVTSADLEAEVQAMRLAKAAIGTARAEAAAEELRISTLTAVGLAQEVARRSAGKLVAARLYGVELVLSVPELLPVTHFKTLAKLTHYSSGTRLFTVQARNLGLQTRQGLLALADKLAKSHKKVTKADIAERRDKIALKRAASRPLAGLSDDDLEDLADAHRGVDVIAEIDRRDANRIRDSEARAERQLEGD